MECDLLQVSGGLLQESVTGGSSGIGSYLGWAMAAIYMGGRLPQICLNVRFPFSIFILIHGLAAIFSILQTEQSFFFSFHLPGSVLIEILEHWKDTQVKPMYHACVSSNVSLVVFLCTMDVVQSEIYSSAVFFY